MKLNDELLFMWTGKEEREEGIMVNSLNECAARKLTCKLFSFISTQYNNYRHNN